MNPSISILVILFAYVAADTCQWTSPSTGYKYDLSPLIQNAADYNFKVSAKGWNMWMNVCRALINSPCGTSNGGTAACQQWDPNTPSGKASLGLQNTMTFQPLANPGPGPNGHLGVTLTYTGGLNGRAFEIDFYCNEDEATGSFVFENENPSKHYNFAFGSKHACPTNYNPPPGPTPSPPSNKKLSGGSILLIVLLVVVVVYLVAGILINKFKLQKNGVELVPNVDFWTSIPGLVRDGILFPINKIRGRGGYQKV